MKNEKFNLKSLFLELIKTIISRKRQIVTSVTVIALLALGSFLIEYYGFAYNLQTLEKTDAGIVSLKKADVETDNFILDEQGIFVSQSENASLVLNTQGKYVQKLELVLSEKSSYGILVKYVDPKTKQEVVLEKKLQKSMQKNKLNFLNFLVFKIENSPEKITVVAVDSQISISDIKTDNSYYFNPYRFIFVFLSGILIVFFVVLRKKIGKNPEYGFFAVALICGTIISFSELRTYVSWDEFIHYERADKGSFKNIVVKDVNDIYAKTNSVVASYSIKEQRAIDAYFDGDKKDKVKKAKLKIGEFSLSDIYNKLGYFPSSIALVFGRIVDLPHHIIFVFGRWINIFLFSLIVFFAIRKLKSGKMIMAIVALFPTSVFLASNYGYDSWVTAFTMLGLAYLFSELQQPEKKITPREMAIMLGALVIGLGPKAIYFLLLLPLFLLKKEKFDSERQYKNFMWASAISTLLVLGSFMLPFVIDGPGKGDKRGGSGVNSVEQVQFILTEPIAYAKILFNFMKVYLNPLNAEGFVTSFAYLGSMKGLYVILATLVVVTFSDKNKFDKETSTLKIKSLIVGIYLATISLICTALYVDFNAVRSMEILGVQPRYLIPLLFPLLFILGSYRIKNPIDKNLYNTVIFSVIAYVLLQGIWDLIIKLYY